MTENLKKLLSELKKFSLNEDTRPSGGIWYFLWLKPHWILEAYKETEYGEMTHATLWEKYLADTIGKHYKADPDEIFGLDSIRNAYTGMPRGRVLMQGGIWMFYHGNDFPISYGKATKLLPSAFELNRHAVLGKVKFEYDDHETMQPEDQETLRQVIGNIPYKPGKTRE